MSRNQQILRLVLRIFCYVVIWFFIKYLARSIPTSGIPFGPWCILIINILINILAAAIIILTTFLFCRFIDKRPWAGMALPRPTKKTLKSAGIGFLLASAMMLIVFGIEYFLGWIHIVGYESNPAIPLLGGLFLFLNTGITEELMMRGYIFQNFAEKFPIWLATLIGGLIFGILHFNQPGFGVMFVLNVLSVVHENVTQG